MVQRLPLHKSRDVAEREQTFNFESRRRRARFWGDGGMKTSFCWDASALTAARRMVIAHCKMGNSLFFRTLKSRKYIEAITVWLHHMSSAPPQGNTGALIFIVVVRFCLLFPDVSRWWLYPFSPPNEFPCFASLILIMWQNVCIRKELASSSCARDFIIPPPHSTLSLSALQLEQIQQMSWDTRLFSKYLRCGFYGQTRRLGPSRLSEGWWTPEHSASIPSKRQTSAPLFLPSKSTSCVLSVQLTPHYGEIT